MDPRTFDGLVQRLSRTLSRRSFVGGSLGATALAAVGLDQRALGKRANGRGRRVAAEHCLAIGERCDPPKRSSTGHRKKKTHTCEGIQKKNGRIVRGCCTLVSVQEGDIRRCACVSDGDPCTDNRNCCSQVCTGGVCGAAAPRCPAGADICTGVQPTCADGACFCQPRMDGSGSACLNSEPPVSCSCESDADCEGGAICVRVTDATGICSLLPAFCSDVPTAICANPCPGGA